MVRYCRLLFPMHNEAFSKGVYELFIIFIVFFGNLKKIPQNLCAGGSLYRCPSC